MRSVRFLGGALLTLAVAAACSDTAPTVPGSELDLARLGPACTISDDARAQVRTVTAGCTNSEAALPEGWTLRVIGGETEGAAPMIRSIGPMQIAQIDMPTQQYVEATDLIEINQIADFTNLTSVSDGVQTVTFNVTMQKRSVPGSWGTWGSPPYTEGNTPHILFTQGATTIEMTLAEPSSIFGFELNPNPFAVHTYTVDYYSGGTLLGSITRQISGDAGARLLAAAVTDPTAAIDRVVVTGTADFAIARLRYNLGTQVVIPVEIENVYSGDPPQAAGMVDLNDEWLYVEILDPLQYRPTGPNGAGAIPFQSANDVRIGEDWETGTPAESYELLDINNDGNLDIRLRWDLQQLIDDGHLDPQTTTLLIWGQDPDDGQLYAGEAQIEIIGSPEQRTLSTAPANNGSGGVFMDLTPTRLVHVVSFDAPFSGTAGTTATVEVWTRPGSYVGFDGSSAGWTLTQSVEATRAGTTVNAPIELDTPIVLQPNQTTAVYLQVVTAGGGLRYTGTGANPPQTTWSNMDLTLFSDVARVTTVPFAGSRFTPRTFSGNVNYFVFP